MCAFRSPKNECISLVWLVLPTSVQNSLGDSRTDNIIEYLTVQSTEQVAVSTVLPVARHEAGGIPILTSATMGTSHNTGSSSLGGDGHSAGMPGRNQASLRRSSRCTYPDQNRASCDVPRAYNSYDRHVAMSQRIWPSISAMHTAYTKSLVRGKTVQAFYKFANDTWSRDAMRDWMRYNLARVNIYFSEAQIVEIVEIRSI